MGMTNAAHKPGPWGIEKCRCGHDSCSQYTISTQRSSGFSEANANRIVACVNACEGINPEAAPELLEALEEMLKLHIAHHNNPAHVYARTLIAKARA